MEVYVIQMGEFQENCYILKDEEKHEVIVIDPGSDSSNVYNSTSLYEVIEEDDTVLAILLTHGHFDHIGGVNELYAKYKCPVYLNKLDEEMSRNANLNFSQFKMVQINSQIPLSFYPSTNKLVIGCFNIEIILTPGHTQGSVVLKVNEKYLFTGDTLFKGSVGRTDLHGGDYYALVSSLNKLKTTIKNPDLIICPGHGPISTWEEELKTNCFLN